MEFSKRHLICILVAVIASCTFFPTVPMSYGAQRMTVPYAASGSGWWSGIAITNFAGNPMTPIVYINNSDGTSDCQTLLTLAAGEIYADLIENIVPSMTLTSRVSLSVVNNSNDSFGVTLFVGQTDGGFGFREFISEGASGTFICPTLPPFPPPLP